MPLHLILPRRFHPSYSLLGRGLRRLSADARRAEALFIVVLTGLVLALLLAQYGAWAVLQPTLEADPSGGTIMMYWGAQVGVWLGLVLTCVLGFTPPIALTCDAEGLHVRRSTHRIDLSYAAITATEVVTPLQFHRRWRRYAGTHTFINRLDGDVLLLHTAQGVVALVLCESDREALLAYLAAQRTPRFASLPASAA